MAILGRTDVVVGNGAYPFFNHQTSRDLHHEHAGRNHSLERGERIVY